MRDLATVADDIGIEYRLVGGQMVRLHVALAGVPEPVVRVTQDADMGIAAASARHPALVPGLQAIGYTRPGASNRFIRATDDGLGLAIDVLVPAWGPRLVPNQQYGDMVLDEIPGLSLALARPGEQIDLTVTLFDGTVMSFPLVIPEINSALCLKVARLVEPAGGEDAVDVCDRPARTGNGFLDPSSGPTLASRATLPPPSRRLRPTDRWRRSGRHDGSFRTGRDPSPGTCPPFCGRDTSPRPKSNSPRHRS